MAGIRLWRCTRCENVASIAVGTTLLCGDCFYRQTVERIMAAAFVSEVLQSPPPLTHGRPGIRADAQSRAARR